ncbi:MAG: SAM-dependent methyltransferase [Nitrospira sp.]|nr:SAM-dependent methyltransferase [Nitrospira sp.]
MSGEGSQPKSTRTRLEQAPPRPGTLYVVGTPIGDPDDITIRALRILRIVPIIAAEDPRSTQALLAYHGITGGIAGTVTSYGPGNLEEKISLLLHRLRRGDDVALVSDSGMPVIQDPGSRLIAAARQAEIPVTSVPGPSALTAAAALSGFSADCLVFEGRLPRSRRRLTSFLRQRCGDRRTAIFFVEERAVAAMLETLASVLPTRMIVLAQNLTMEDEQIHRGTAPALLKLGVRLRKGGGTKTTVVVTGATSAKRSADRRKIGRPT